MVKQVDDFSRDICILYSIHYNHSVEAIKAVKLLPDKIILPFGRKYSLLHVPHKGQDMYISNANTLFEANCLSFLVK